MEPGDMGRVVGGSGLVVLFLRGVGVGVWGGEFGGWVGLLVRVCVGQRLGGSRHHVSRTALRGSSPFLEPRPKKERPGRIRSRPVWCVCVKGLGFRVLCV